MNFFLLFIFLYNLKVQKCANIVDLVFKTKFNTMFLYKIQYEKNFRYIEIPKIIIEKDNFKISTHENDVLIVDSKIEFPKTKNINIDCTILVIFQNFLSNFTWTQRIFKNIYLYDISTQNLFFYKPFKAHEPEIEKVKHFQNPSPLYFKNTSLTFECNIAIFGSCRIDVFDWVRVFAEKIQAKINISNKESDFAMELIEKDSYENSYFLEFESVSIMLPTLNTEMKSYKYFLMEFDKFTWICLIFFVIYFAFINYVLNWIQGNLKDFTVEVLKSFLMLLGNGDPTKNTSILPRLIHIKLAIFGYLVSTLYCLYLGSFLIKDIESSNSKIICSSFLTEHIRNNSPDILTKLRPRLIVPDEQNSNFVLYNIQNSFGFCIFLGFWKKFLGLKGNKANYVFQLQDYRIGSLPVTVKVRKDFFYKAEFNRYLVDIYSFGIYQKWGKFMELRNKSRYVKASRAKAVSELDMEDMYFIWIVLGTGFFVAFICFVVEVCIFPFLRQFLKRQF